MTITTRASRLRVHPAWLVAAVSFVALIGAAGFRAAPGPLMGPLNEEFGWSTASMSLAVSINLVLYGLTAPFAAALMDTFGIRRVTTVALILVAAGSGLARRTLQAGDHSGWAATMRPRNAFCRDPEGDRTTHGCRACPPYRCSRWDCVGQPTTGGTAPILGCSPSQARTVNAGRRRF